MAEDMEKRVAQYVQIRDAIEALQKRHSEELKPLRELLDALGGRIQQFLDTNNLENLKTSAGSCYLSTRYTTSVADAKAFMDYVVESKNFDLLERRANATAVKAYVQEHGHLPAGVNMSALTSVGVRRAPGT